MLALAQKQRKMLNPQDHSGLRLLRSSRRGKVCRGQGHHPTRISRPNHRPAPGYCALVAREPIFKQDAKDQGRTRAASLDEGRIAVWLILREDWYSFHAALLGQILHPSGEIVHERMASAGAAVRGGRG
ncbi:hypothetical protein BWO90_08870 (plasmid) [Sinorhizobium meliloti]|nr:hypothetical protein BWO90_08870 [Sinorhizobium meliloti]